METTYRFEADGPGTTRVTLRNRGRPAGFASVGAPLVSAAVRAANGEDLARLRDLLERDADPDG